MARPPFLHFASHAAETRCGSACESSASAISGFARTSIARRRSSSIAFADPASDACAQRQSVQSAASLRVGPPPCAAWIISHAVRLIRLASAAAWSGSALPWAHASAALSTGPGGSRFSVNALSQSAATRLKFFACDGTGAASKTRRTIAWRSCVSASHFSSDSLYAALLAAYSAFEAATASARSGASVGSAAGPASTSAPSTDL